MSMYYISRKKIIWIYLKQKPTQILLNSRLSSSINITKYKRVSSYKKNGIVKLEVLRLLSGSLLSAISFKLVHDFLLRFLDAPVNFSPSIEGELFSGSACFLAVDLFLFLISESNRANPLLTIGVEGSVVEVSSDTVGKFSSPSFLLIFTEPTDLWNFEWARFDSSLTCLFGVPLLKFRCEQKWQVYTTLFWVEVLGFLLLCRALALFFSIRTVQLLPGWRIVSHLQTKKLVNLTWFLTLLKIERISLLQERGKAS